MDKFTVDEWRSIILAGWSVYGNGTQLDPRTVEYLASEFAQPLIIGPKSFPVLPRIYLC
jgi:hypothetical protein